MAASDLRKRRRTLRAQMDPAAYTALPPELPGVDHRYIKTCRDLTIHRLPSASRSV
jgi:hypothetical protein